MTLADVYHSDTERYVRRNIESFASGREKELLRSFVTQPFEANPPEYVSRDVRLASMKQKDHARSNAEFISSELSIMDRDFIRREMTAYLIPVLSMLMFLFSLATLTYFISISKYIFALPAALASVGFASYALLRLLLEVRLRSGNDTHPR